MVFTSAESRVVAHVAISPQWNVKYSRKCVLIRHNNLHRIAVFMSRSVLDLHMLSTLYTFFKAENRGLDGKAIGLVFMMNPLGQLMILPIAGKIVRNTN